MNRDKLLREVSIWAQIGHASVSVAIGASIWAATREPLAVPAAVATAVLNDADHLLDYYQWYIRKDLRRLYLLFHAWEFVIVGAVVIGFWPHAALLATVLGHLGHLVGDSVANRPKSLLTYTLVYRGRCGFDRDRLVRWAPPTLSEALHHNLPLWRLIEPRLPRRVSRLLDLDRRSGP